MRNLLLGFAAPLAATLVSPAPAQAQDWAASAFTSGQAMVGSQFVGPPAFPDGLRDCRDSGRPHHGGHRRGGSACEVLVGGWGYVDGTWALYNNHSWDPDSYNGWWHDRPDRAYPRWVQHNQNCDRRWWGGGVWRCSW